MRKLPSFFIIGAAKSGTTSLHNYLSSHPSIHMPTPKETRYFCAIGLEQSKWINGHGRVFTDIPKNLDAYCRTFDGAADNAIWGEACPDYMVSQIAAEAINHLVPNAKIICILRHPIERAFSNWSYRANLTSEEGTFSQAIEEDLRGVRNNWMSGRIVEEGFYYKHLSFYRRLFPDNQIKIFLYEDLVQDSKQVCSDIFDFIGVDDLPSEAIGQIHNKRPSELTAYSSSAPIAYLGRIRKLRRIASHLPDSLKSRLRGKRHSVPPMTMAERTRLLEVYKKDILALEKLIGRDLSAWKI